MNGKDKKPQRYFSNKWQADISLRDRFIVGRARRAQWGEGCLRCMNLLRFSVFFSASMLQALAPWMLSTVELVAMLLLYFLAVPKALDHIPRLHLGGFQFRHGLEDVVGTACGRAALLAAAYAFGIRYNHRPYLLASYVLAVVVFPFVIVKAVLFKKTKADAVPAVLIFTLAGAFCWFHVLAARRSVEWARRRYQMGLVGFGYPWEEGEDAWVMLRRGGGGGDVEEVTKSSDGGGGGPGRGGPGRGEDVPAETLADDDSKFVEVGSVKVHYKEALCPSALEAGSSSTTTGIVLVHGFGGGVFAWRHLLQPLATQCRCRVVAFDRPAFGLTSRPKVLFGGCDNPYAMGSQAELMLRVCAVLGLRRVVLVAHADGCLLALRAAALAHSQDCAPFRFRPPGPPPFAHPSSSGLLAAPGSSDLAAASPRHALSHSLADLFGAEHQAMAAAAAYDAGSSSSLAASGAALRHGSRSGSRSASAGGNCSGVGTGGTFAVSLQAEGAEDEGTAGGPQGPFSDLDLPPLHLPDFEEACTNGGGASSGPAGCGGGASSSSSSAHSHTLMEIDVPADGAAGNGGGSGSGSRSGSSGGGGWACRQLWAPCAVRAHHHGGVPLASHHSNGADVYSHITGTGGPAPPPTVPQHRRCKSLPGQVTSGTKEPEWLTSAAPHPEVLALALLHPNLSGQLGPALTRLLARSQLGRSILRPLLRTEVGEVANRRAWHDSDKLTPEVLELYKAPLRVEGWDRALMETTRLHRDAHTGADAGAGMREARALPSLLVSGEHDRIVPTARVEALCSELPRSHLAVLRDCGHLSHEEVPRALLAELVPFCGEVLDHQRRLMQATSAAAAGVSPGLGYGQEL